MVSKVSFSQEAGFISSDRRAQIDPGRNGVALCVNEDDPTVSRMRETISQQFNSETQSIDQHRGLVATHFFFPVDLMNRVEWLMGL